MLIREWMTKDVITVTPDTSMMKASKILKENRIRRLPVVDAEGRLIGIVSDRDIKEASPSKATTLDMYEMHYLLAELKAKNIMTAKPITVKPTDTVEQAALIMLDNKVGGLPVVDDNGKLVGIISDHDVFKALVDITGARMGGLQFAIELPDQPGTARPLFDLLRAHNARLLSVLTVSNADGNRQLFIRVRDLENSKAEQELMDGVGKLGKVLYCQH